MAGAPIFWETGKYAVALIFALGLLRLGWRASYHPLAATYLVLLLPSSMLIVGNPYWTTSAIMDSLSFALSGPLALAMSTWYCSHVRLSTTELRRVSVALLGPIVGIAWLTINATYLSGPVSFSLNSNMQTSAGFGPNQVSAALGLGALIALVATNLQGTSTLLATVLVGALPVLASQSVMTFSRSGMYGAVAPVILALPFYIRSGRWRRRVALLSVVLLPLAAWIILPRLDAFTEGKLTARFSSIATTGRGLLAADDVRIWTEHALLGVGPNQSRIYRETVGGISHTEFARLVAEHGLLGLAALLSMIAIAAKAVRRAHDPQAKALAVICFGWSFIYMAHASMRIAAPAFLFGLGCAALPGGKGRAERLS
jgi:hypothetical protein